ncbi:eukaryotic translation initiation factor 3 subunit M isoform X1 [Vigna radiata var. radiata]|uniref:Eukaryotic translation initiation factor 3 subunit M n=1 Tax=Vigna radiata var. radiata TaxID=3916 RepID=A0A1S3V8Z2_VIGRR|nr:eukaryotic translation initiation factor 3 subunit M isoform X2 [Vigna radiata var. radiata]XP_014514755.1 eukaryotic translation initiation factor 3 subunit M isoform X1 [Vigna radiata var. radiata]
MATVVPTSEEDAALTVVRFASELAWADAGPEVAEPQVSRLCMEAEEFIVMGKWLELASLMITSAELIFSKVSEKDIESIFTIICNLVTKTANPDEAMEIVKVVTAKILQQPNEKPVVRLKILINLYNLLETPYCQFYVYMKTLNLAVDGKVTEFIIPSFKKIDHFLKDWKIGIPEQRELFLAISNILKENKSMSKDALKFLTSYLATFLGEDAQVLSEAKEEAAHAIVEFVRAPDIFQCDLLDLPAVAQLEKDAKYGLLYELLKIFVTQRLDAYLEYHAANSTLLKTYGLVHEECIAKMKLMSLVDLSSDPSGTIPYELIRDTLRINDDEVELWVVRAITAKLIDCKLDQMNQVVVVSHPTERVFGQHQWQALRTKLATWRGNVANVISTIQANKITEDGAQAAQGLVAR